jgi:hypothetical protein
MASSAPPSIYFPGINWNISFYTEGDSNVTLNYVNANFLRSTGYAFSRAITTSFNGIIYALNGIDTTNINATGTITANLFNGSGAGLRSLNASNISGGTLGVNIGGTGRNVLPFNRILVGNGTDPVITSANLIWQDNILYGGKFAGSGAELTNLNATNISDGTLAVTRGGTGVNSLIDNRILIGGTSAITQSGNLTWDNTNNILTATNFSGNGLRLTNLNASNVSDGTLSVSRGGTGATTFTAGRLLIGNGTSAITEDPELTWNTTTNILNVTGTINSSGLITAAGLTSSGLITGNNNLVISGSAGIVGTSQFTGNMGIGTAASVDANTKLNVSGDINIVGNNRYRIGGNAIGIWLTGTIPTNIYYTTGNVSIGSIDTSAADDNTNFVMPTAPFYVRGESSINAGVCDVVFRGGAINVNGGRSRLWLAGGSSHSTYIQGEHTTGGSTVLTFGTANGNVLPVERMRINNLGNVGIGNTNPLGTLHLGDASQANNDGHIIFARCTTVGSTRICRAGYNNNFDFCIGDIGGNNTLGTWLQQFRINFQAPADSLVVSGSGYVGIGTVPSYRAHIRCNYNNAATGLHLDANDNGNPNQYSLTIWPYVIGGGEVGWRFRVQTQVGGDNTPLTLNSNGNVVIQSNLNVGSLTVNSDTFISSSRLVLRGNNPTLYLRDTDHRSGMIHMNGNIMYFLNASGNDSETWASQNGQNWALQIDMNNNLATFGGQITAFFVAVSLTNTDYLCVQTNYAFAGQGASQRICVGFGSFTAFHRCYTDDELYNNETDESIDLFKNNYMGRVVIATGKIKSDFTRTIEANTETEIDGLSGLPREKEKINEWYSEIDKDGISVEDAVPVVQLSRQRKDKRVFGVLGTPKRSTNNKDRLIVNSIGEGAICVANTNGNIENGDYIQSSNLLGYGEKQDDDLLHNYTIAKSTIDCNFELDNPYYQCHEIENGVRVAFIACTYHCG